MFERFTDRARRVVVLASEQARVLGHSHIGTEHILLGLLAEGDGVAARALNELGVDLRSAHDEVVSVIGRGADDDPRHIAFTPRAKKALELSLREALRLHHSYIGTEHILLGLARLDEGTASEVLDNLGASIADVRDTVMRRLSGPASVDMPACACSRPLAATLTYREVTAPGTEQAGHRLLVFFCGNCGRAAGTTLAGEDASA